MTEDNYKKLFTAVVLGQMMRTLEGKYQEAEGFRHSYIRWLRTIRLDGGVNAAVVFGLYATRDGLASRIYIHESGPGTGFAQLKWKFKAMKVPPDHSVKFHVRDQSPTRFMGSTEFSPPLHMNDEVVYKICEEASDVYIMTKEGIHEMIRLGRWLLKEPYEWTKFLVLYPTDKLVMEATFPEEYPIEGKQLFDVTLGESIYRNWTEASRLENENAFSSQKIKGEHGQKQVLHLEVDRPVIGMCYWLRWVPPSNEIYRRLLNSSRSHNVSALNARQVGNS